MKSNSTIRNSMPQEGAFNHTVSNLDASSKALKDELYRFRMMQSQTLGKLPHHILTNATIEEICKYQPNTIETLYQIKGIGSKTLEMFGQSILNILAPYCSQDIHTYTSSLNTSIYKETSEFQSNPILSRDDLISIQEITNGEIRKENKEPKKKKKKISKTQLRQDLKDYRMQQISDDDDKPLYTIFTNSALEGIYASLPTTMEELLKVKGIGPKKAQMYGKDILSIVSKYTGNHSNATESEDEDCNNVPKTHSFKETQPTITIESLTMEQRQAAEFILHDRKNVFITGSAGTGKSYLLKYLVQELRKKSHPISKETLKVAICAPTGVSAILVGGNTIHSFFGIGLGITDKLVADSDHSSDTKGYITTLLNKVKRNSAAKKRIDETDVLIIDECSMLSSELFETLDVITRELRKDGLYRDEPFGGLQIITFGDFYQLPPVERKYRNASLRSFCFESQVWSDLGLSDHTIELQEVQRQERLDFINLLNKVRVGQLDLQDIHYLNSKCLIRESNPLPNDGIIPTRLYVLNKDVDFENESRLAEISSPEIICSAVDIWRQPMPKGTPDRMIQNMITSLDMELPKELKLKIGAQVMLTRNNKDVVGVGEGGVGSKSLVNGSRGVVEGFTTIGYLEDGSAITTTSTTTSYNSRILPIVRFDNGVITTILPVESVRYHPDGSGMEGCLVRTQIPLKLAWAITIHKSQGSTLTRASLDISSAFEYGQSYVALSRVKSLDGLWLEKPIRLSHILVSPQVMDFYSKTKKQA